MSGTLAELLLSAPCAATVSAASADGKAVVTAAHDAYVNATSSYDLGAPMIELTDELRYRSPGEAQIAGKAAGPAWDTAYFGSTHTRWQKTPIGFMINGAGVVDRYRHRSTDTDRLTGTLTRDIGKGLALFHRGGAGRWPGAVNGWSSDPTADS